MCTKLLLTHLSAFNVYVFPIVLHHIILGVSKFFFSVYTEKELRYIVDKFGVYIFPVVYTPKMYLNMLRINLVYTKQIICTHQRLTYLSYE